jgi:alkylation response protein AidB-like acyl-CoA dehydrogenase
VSAAVATVTAADRSAVRPLAARTGLDATTVEALIEHAAARAAAVDRGEADLADSLRFLGDRGLLGVAASGAPGGRERAAGVVATLARACTATAFVTWAQLTVIDYLGHAGPALRSVREALVAGRLAGSPAMAPAFQDELGLRGLTVDVERDAGAVRLDGTIGWASNLHPGGFVVVLPARGPDGHRCVVAVPSSAAGVAVRPAPPLLALTATASSGLTLDGVRLPDPWVVSDAFSDFLAAVRRPFLTVQAAFCVGLAETALDEAPLDGPDRTSLLDEHAHLVARHRHVTDELLEELLAAGPTTRRTVALRLDAARLAVDAVALEAKARGGAGYVATSPTARRLREAAFIPIQSPTEAQLRWELQRSA